MSGASQDGHRPGLVTIVVPAKDEEAVIGRTLRSLPLSTLRLARCESEVVVLDGRSSDATADIACRFGATVLRDREEGKGAALRHALPLLRGEYVVMVDADGTYAADAIPRVVGLLARGEADVVMGRRVPQPGAMKRTHRAGNALLSLAARTLYARPCPDLCTGLWGFRRDALAVLPLASRGFELEAELFALSSRLGLCVRHVDVDYLPRHGRAKLESARDGLRIAACLLRCRFARIDAGPDGTPRVETGAHQREGPA